MNPWLAALLGGGVGLVGGFALTNPIFGPNVFLFKPAQGGTRQEEGAVCGQLLFGGTGKCNPGLECNPNAGLLGGVCAKPDYDQNNSLLRAGLALAVGGGAFALAGGFSPGNLPKKR